MKCWAETIGGCSKISKERLISKSTFHNDSGYKPGIIRGYGLPWNENKLIEILKFVSPGTPIREGIDNILMAGNGAIIVIGDTPEVMMVVNGGFYVNSEFTPQRLTELSKLDGAIIIDSEIKKILFCNTLLAPDSTIKTNETGTRHQAAERTAKQTGKLVIAISERRKIIALYFEDIKYILKPVDELLNRANESLGILEKNKEIFDEFLLNLNLLEFTNSVTMGDFAFLVQRAEILQRIAFIIGRYITELGKEGNLIKIQLKEIMKNFEKEKFLVLRDYCKDFNFSRRALLTLSIDELIEIDNVLTCLLYNNLDKNVAPKGLRLLNKTLLSHEEIEALVKNFKFNRLLELVESGDLKKILEVIPEISGRESVLKALLELKKQALLSKKI